MNIKIFLFFFIIIIVDHVKTHCLDSVRDVTRVPTKLCLIFHLIDKSMLHNHNRSRLAHNSVILNGTKFWKWGYVTGY